MEMSQADSEVEDLLMHTYTNTDDDNVSMIDQGKDQSKGRKRKDGTMRSAKQRDMSHDVGGRRTSSRGKRHYTSTRQSKLYDTVKDNKMARKKIGSATTDVHSNSSSSSKSLRSKTIKKKV